MRTLKEIKRGTVWEGIALQRQVSKSTKREAAVSAWKTPPAVMQDMMVGFGADFECHEMMLRRAFFLRDNNNIRYAISRER